MSLKTEYSSQILDLLSDYINNPPTYQNVETKLIVSKDNGDCLIFAYGRHNTKPVHECILHLQIEADKILIRCDRTKIELSDALLKTGISSEQIIYPDAPQQEIIDYTVSLEKIYEFHSSLFEVTENFTKSLKLNVTSAQLVELTKINCDYLNCAIAFHPNTPPNLLTKLFPKFPLQVLTNPVMDLLLLEQPKFIEEIDEKYGNFLSRNGVIDISLAREWATQKKQEDVTYETSISNINPTFLLTRTVDVRHHAIIQNLWKNGRLPLNIKNNPAETMRSLDAFLSSLFGDREVECEPDFDALEARQIPIPFKHLCSFIEKYLRENGGWLGHQDSLFNVFNDSAIDVGKIAFLGENQGVWSCATETEGYDPPVWISGIEDNRWDYLCDSLTEFLVTYCLSEVLLGRWDNSIVKPKRKEGHQFAFVWEGIYAWDVYFAIITKKKKRNNIRSFYCLENNV